MVSGFIAFVVKSYYIYAWLVLHLWSIFITFMVGITLVVFSAECTFGIVWGLTPLKHDGNNANIGTQSVRGLFFW